MFRSIGPLELTIILAIVVLLFGASRLGGIGGAVGQSIREFRKASRDPDEEARKEREEERKRLEAAGSYTPASTVERTPPPPAASTSTSTSSSRPTDFKPS